MFRIYTEGKNRESIVKIVSAYVDSFTVIPAIGYWQGQKEKSLIIEMVCKKGQTEQGLLADVRCIAESIKVHNKQEAVLIVNIKTETQLI